MIIALLAFIGLGAIFGGGALLIDHSGNILQMPLEMLETSPFTNFLVPGLLLFIFIGVLPLITIYGLVFKPGCKPAGHLSILKASHWSVSITLYNGFAIIIWITVQMLMINAFHWLHSFYIFLSLAIILLSLLAEKYSLNGTRFN